MRRGRKRADGYKSAYPGGISAPKPPWWLRPTAKKEFKCIVAELEQRHLLSQAAGQLIVNAAELAEQVQRLHRSGKDVHGVARELRVTLESPGCRRCHLSAWLVRLVIRRVAALRATIWSRDPPNSPAEYQHSLSHVSILLGGRECRQVARTTSIEKGGSLWAPQITTQGEFALEGGRTLRGEKIGHTPEWSPV